MDAFSQSDATYNDYHSNQVIIKFKNELSKAQSSRFRQDLKAQLGVKEEHRLDFIDAEVWDLPSGNVEGIIAKYQDDSLIEYIEPNYFIYPIGLPMDPSYGSQWDMDLIQMPDVWDIHTGDTMIIAIIDDGVDYLHADLADNIWTNAGEIPGNNIDDDMNGYIDDIHGYDFVELDGDPFPNSSHGTICAGIIGAVGNNNLGVAGINWNIQMMVLRIFSPTGQADVSRVVDAISYACEMGAKLSNNSWITGNNQYSHALYKAIQMAGMDDCLFVAGTNNGSGDNGIYYPAFYDLDNIIAVTAVDQNDSLGGTYNAISVDLGAPGGCYCTIPNNGYSASSSIATSWATPHVSGVAALMWSLNPSWSYQQIKSAILENVSPNPSLNNRTVTGGRLNALNAVQSLFNETTFTSGVWDNGIPTAISTAIFNDDYDAVDKGSINAYNVLINPGIAVSIGANKYMHIRNELEVNGNLIVGEGADLQTQYVKN